MKFPGRFTSGFLLMVSSCAVFADAQLDVKIKPSNSALKSNIEGYVGSLGERDEQALERFSVGAVEQAQKAAQALGYYQAQVDSEVKRIDKNLHLILSVQSGEPVHLRNVTVRIEGPASQLKAFRVPKSDALKTGAVLNHGNYEDARN